MKLQFENVPLVRPFERRLTLNNPIKKIEGLVLNLKESVKNILDIGLYELHLHELHENTILYLHETLHKNFTKSLGINNVIKTVR